MQIGNIVNSVMGQLGGAGGAGGMGGATAPGQIGVSGNTIKEGMSWFESIGNAFKGGKATGTEVGGVVGGFLETGGTIFQSGVGQQVSGLSDKLGLPEWLGDIGGGVADALTGNWVSCAGHGADLLGDVSREIGKAVDRGKSSKSDSYAEASGQVSGMYNEEPSVAAGRVEAASDTSAKTASSIETGKEAYAAYERGDVAEAGKKAAEGARESVMAEAESHPDVSEEDAKKGNKVFGTIISAVGMVLSQSAMNDPMSSAGHDKAIQIGGILENFGASVSQGEGGFDQFAMQMGGMLMESMNKGVGGQGGQAMGDMSNQFMQMLGMMGGEGGGNMEMMNDFATMFASAGESGDIASMIGGAMKM
jgi:hypothetical protein